MAVVGLLALLWWSSRANDAPPEAVQPSPSALPREDQAERAFVDVATPESGGTVEAPVDDARTAMEAPPEPSVDDAHRMGRLRALRAALAELQTPATSSQQRAHQLSLLSTASVATLLDAQGRYREPPVGQLNRVEHLEGHERVNFNGRLYYVPHGEFPEFEEARALRRQFETESAGPRPLESTTEGPISADLVQLVVARANAAILIVESDLKSKRVQFR